ncbi:transposase [Pseudomonas fluorescens]|uniref:transposase n=1 Tax=Pseudomonas fluorescens TaxID=294 RepID=UPI001240D4B8
MQPKRRSYSKSFKIQVIQECTQPGASIASIALSHNLNAKSSPQMDSSACAEKHGAATCIQSGCPKRCLATTYRVPLGFDL